LTAPDRKTLTESPGLWRLERAKRIRKLLGHSKQQQRCCRKKTTQRRTMAHLKLRANSPIAPPKWRGPVFSLCSASPVSPFAYPSGRKGSPCVTQPLCHEVHGTRFRSPRKGYRSPLDRATPLPSRLRFGLEPHELHSAVG